jgi:SAM-dependent methyltransferase
MTRANDRHFDAGVYWSNRVGVGADLAVVGHRSMGSSYNREIYARRVEVLESYLSLLNDRAVSNLRILDVGCGSGFYAQFWQAHGVRDYTGLDVSRDSVAWLSGKYSSYKFVNADITGDVLTVLGDSSAFDIITVFDVFYHIVDDHRFESAIANISKLVRADGYVLVMDQLCRRTYQLSRHVRYRARARYLAAFESRGLRLVENELLFHFLVPPITEIRVVDYLSATLFKLMGLAVRRFDGLSTWIACRLRQLDKWMRSRGRTVSNSEFLVLHKSLRPGNQ